MSAQSARLFIVLASFTISAALIGFFLMSPLFGMPFDEQRGEHVRLIEITLPTFLAYLASATHFVFSASKGIGVGDENRPLLGVLIGGSFGLFITANIFIFTAFYLMNQPGQAGMSIDQVSRLYSVALGLLAATVSVASGHLFGSPPKLSGHASARKTS